MSEVVESIFHNSGIRGVVQSTEYDDILGKLKQWDNSVTDENLLKIAPSIQFIGKKV